jgi:HAD superfamily hydrolase (TIGR01458 family)
MQAILFDLDGVVYNSETPVPGASEALAWVRKQNIPHLFVTNTTSRGRGVLAEKLQRFGVLATEDQILTPCVAAHEHMRTTARDGDRAALFVPAKTMSEFDGIPLLPDDSETGARWVVVGDMGPGWDFPTLNRAFRLLKSNPETELIALGLTRFWLAEDGLSLDAGAYVAALEYAASRSPVVMGKPAPAFFHAAAARLSVDPAEILMIGDDVVVDVNGAQRSGMKGALVKTGKFREADLAGASMRPDYVMDSIVGLPELWASK